MSLNASQIEALLASPAMSPPDGVIPDFTNPPNSNGTAWFVITFTLVLSTICVFIRAFHKVYLTHKIQIEEGKRQSWSLGRCEYRTWLTWRLSSDLQCIRKASEFL